MIKNSLRTYAFYLSIFVPVLTVQAQMVNKGVMIIEEGTKDVITFFDFTNEKDFTNNGNFHVMADFVNKGKVDHDNNGTVLFKGTDQQKNKKIIDGGGNYSSENYTSFYNVIFDSPVKNGSDNAAFQLLGAVDIAGKTDFKRGIVNNRYKSKDTLGVITFLKGASIEGVSRESYVNGEVEKIGDEAFPEFPIGSYGRGEERKHYRYAGISAPPEVSHFATAKYFLEESDSKYSHNNRETAILAIDNNEYWKLTGTDNLILTLSWDEATTPPELLKDPQSLHIVHWDSTTERWVDFGGIVDETTKTVVAPVKGEGIFTLASVDAIKEGEIRVFNAISPNEDGKNDKFYVEVNNKCKCFDKLAVKIYNRWGVQVYGSDNYLSDDDANTFYGYSNGRVVVDKGTLLSRGTYYYILEYEFTDDSGNKHSGNKVGYLYIANDPNVNGTL